MKLTDSDIGARGNLPFVSVIIPARNEAGYIATCLESVIAGSYPRELMEILVVDGKSDDGTGEIVQQLSERFSLIKLLDNPAAIVPHAMNIGISAARGEVLVRMDAHARYPADYVEQLVTGLLRLGADNVGGVCLARPASDRPQARAVALILSNPFGVGGSDHRIGGGDQPAEVDTVPFGCYRREVFNRIGTYDEMFVRNQDDELNARLRIAGGRVFLLPHVKIEYFTRASLRKMSLMLYQYGYYKPLVAIKLGRPATLRQMAPPAFTAAVLGLPFVFAVIPWALLLWAMIIGAHSLVNFAVSFTQARRAGWRLLPYLFSGYLAAHLSYGFGYLRGILNFGLLRRHLSKTQRSIPLSR